MQRPEKEQIVAELTERLQSTETLIVADYRGLSVKEVDELRTKLIEHGASFTVVKNSLTRRAAQAAGVDAVLALLDGPTAIAFLEAEGDPVAVAKALSDSAKTTRVLAVRGGVMQGRTITPDDIEELAKLPPVDVLRGQVLGAVSAPLYAIVGLFTAPLQDLYGLIEARIEQLGGETATEEPAAEAATEEPAAEAPGEEPQAVAEEPTAEDEEEETESPQQEAEGEKEE
jgi:large subunit ribosomal protein L10